MISTFSVICPIYNESKYIDDLLSFLSSCNPQPLQIFFIDGGSTDDSVEIIELWKEKIPQLELLHNSERTVPYALNMAIPLCIADVIVRIDAHSLYAGDYFEKIIETFNNTQADIVGGPTRTAFKVPFQEAVAYVFNTPLGMGNSSVHSIDFEGYTDSVTFGAWKKNIFQKTGFFETALKRNQDDEFHYRARSLGFKIYQNPKIKLLYYPRSTWSSLFKQYFQYGLFKPIVLSKIRSGISLRHLVPSIFFLYILMLIGFGLFFSWILFPILVYLILVLFFTIKSTSSLLSRLIIPVVYPTIHIAYGTGFLIGFFNLFKRQ